MTDLLLFGGQVANVYSSAIWHYKSQLNQWYKVGDMLAAADHVGVMPVQGISCFL